MDKLTFLLIIAGIGVVLLVVMFTYYKHHKRINDEIKNFNNHSHNIDDVLLNDHNKSSLEEDEFPDSFSANRQDNFDIEQVDLNNDAIQHAEKIDERELVDGVYINTKRVISQNNHKPVNSPDSTEPNINIAQHTIPTFKTRTSTQSEPSARTPAEQPQPETAIPSEPTAAPEADSVPVDKSTLAYEAEDKQFSVVKQNIHIVAVPLPEGVDDLIISHSILAKDEYFSGVQLFKAFSNAGLQYGEMNIFHYPGDDSKKPFALFSVANLVEPGTFDPDSADDFTTPGISLFMRLPSRMDNYKAYDKLLEVARHLADELNAELCDETRSQLTRQSISYKKEQIRKLNFNIAKAERLAGMSH